MAHEELKKIVNFVAYLALDPRIVEVKELGIYAPAYVVEPAYHCSKDYMFGKWQSVECDFARFWAYLDGTNRAALIDFIDKELEKRD